MQFLRQGVDGADGYREWGQAKPGGSGKDGMSGGDIDLTLLTEATSIVGATSDG